MKNINSLIILFIFFPLSLFASPKFYLTVDISENVGFSSDSKWTIKINGVNQPVNHSDFRLSKTFKNNLLVVGVNTFIYSAESAGCTSKEKERTRVNYKMSLNRDGKHIFTEKWTRVGGCKKQHSRGISARIPLSQLDPELFNEIEDYEKRIRERSRNYKQQVDDINDDLRQKAKEYEKQLQDLYNFYDQVRRSSFEDLFRLRLEILDLEEIYYQVQKKIADLNSDIERRKIQIEQDLKRSEKKLKISLKKFYSDKKIKEIITDRSKLEPLFPEEIETSNSEISHFFIEECKIWKSKITSSQSELSDFFKTSQKFLHQTQRDLTQLKKRKLSRQVYLDIEKCTQEVETIIFKTFDQNLWPKTSSIPKVTKNYIDNEFHNYNPEIAKRIKQEMISWGRILSDDERKAIAVFNELGKFMKGFLNTLANTTSEALNLKTQVDKVLNETIIAAKVGFCEVGSLPLNDYRDFYELIKGKNYCSGVPLSLEERALTTFGLLIGSGNWWREAAAAIGIITVAKKSKKIVDSARKLGMKVASSIKAFAIATKGVSNSRLNKIVELSPKIKPSNIVQIIDPDIIKFSQAKVNDIEEIVESMKKHGWIKEKGSIDVVKMSDGTLITADNTRLLAASRAGIKVQAKVRSSNELLSSEFQKRFKTKKDGIPKTWEEVIKFRINKQNSKYRKTYPSGSYITSSEG